MEKLETALYGFGIRLYASGVKAASIRMPKASKLIEGHKDTWKKLETLTGKDSYIWIHAASLGEFEQARPVIERIKRTMPEKKILLTFFSPSGYEIRKNYDGADLICYLPFDTEPNAIRFIEAVKPQMAIFVKYEIWRNYLRQLSLRNIPAYLISAAFRPDQIFFRNIGQRYRRWLGYFKTIFVQEEGSRKLLEGIGYKNVEVAGDTRFDRVSDILAQCKELPLIQKFSDAAKQRNDLTFIVGSSWQPDENAYIPWLNATPGISAIIAPHEFDAERLATLQKRLKIESVLYSELQSHPERALSAKVVIIDCFGLLSSIYRFADIAYVGGGFGVGIHNINEAAVYGIPVIFGPNYHRFVEAEQLVANGGAITYDNTADFASVITPLIDNEQQRLNRGKTAGEYIKSKLGASDYVFKAIFGSTPNK